MQGGGGEFDASVLLRRVRRLARLSQRDLAELAGISVSVVARIESRAVPNPGVRTVDRLVRAAGFGLDVVVDKDGQNVGVAVHPAEGVRDLSGRRLPAHVEAVAVGDYLDNGPVRWWAWPYKWSTLPASRPPEHTYTLRRGPYFRPALDPVTGGAVARGTMLDWEAEQRRLRSDLAACQPAVLWTRERRRRVGSGTPVSRIGVFALQGDVREHLRALESAGCAAEPVRRPAELAAVDALVLPGGESTTMIKLARTFELLEPLRERIADGMPVYGSCAGMILLADRLDSGGSPLSDTIGGLDITVRRNAFGRQVDSFEQDIPFEGIDGDPVRAVFIRAPWVQEVGPAVQVLGRTLDGQVVAVRQGALLATSFHPEMTGDGRVHAYFCAMVADQV